MIDTTENSFSRNLSLTDVQVTGLRNAFANSPSEDIKLSKTRLSKITLSSRFLATLLE